MESSLGEGGGGMTMTTMMDRAREDDVLSFANWFSGLLVRHSQFGWIAALLVAVSLKGSSGTHIPRS